MSWPVVIIVAVACGAFGFAVTWMAFGPGSKRFRLEHGWHQFYYGCALESLWQRYGKFMFQTRKDYYAWSRKLVQ